ncbi:MAG: WYL domain-containing protein [Lachnospiraceae bacterium]|nr:WYL domain-containing protein [Lachnospiraceae bacterium]
MLKHSDTLHHTEVAGYCRLKNYYCIGLKKEDKRVWHYRVDLMSDVEIVCDEEGKMMLAEVCAFDGLPISNTCWNPEKYMSEHLNMAYDEPRDIYIKIRNSDYTILHDWFGNHYKKTKKACEEGYDIVVVKTSPSMMVHWAMQYGTKVEIMDEEIRAKIRDEIGKMREMYGAK